MILFATTSLMNKKLHSPKSSHIMVDGPAYIPGQGDQKMTALDYEAYPAHNKSLPAGVFDRAVYGQRLADDAGRLFSSSEINIDIAIRNAKTRSVTWKSQRDNDLKYEATSQNHESTLSPAWSLLSRYEPPILNNAFTKSYRNFFLKMMH